MSRHSIRGLAVLVLAVAIPACGGGSGGGGGGLPANQRPVAAIGTPGGTVAGNVTINYTLSDAESNACTIVAEFSVNGGGSFATATRGSGGEGLASLAASPAGTAHAFVWNSLADGVATGSANPTVRFRVTPSDADPGTAAATPNFAVDNSANTAPSVSVTTPGAVHDNVVIGYTLTDMESNQCSIVVEYSTNGGGSFAPATAGPGGDGLSGLASSPGGVAHTVVWNSLADGVGTSGPNGNVRIRITPTDTATGPSGTSANFTVNNSGNTAPSVSITPLIPTGGMVSFQYTLMDAESSTCSVLIQVSEDGGGTFFPPSKGPGGEPTSGLTSSPGGTAHVFVWNSFEDGVGTGSANSMVKVRITPSDALTGTSATSANFTVDNTTSFSGGSVGTPYPVTLHPGYQATGMASDGYYLYVVGHNFSQWIIDKVDPVTGTSVWSKTSDPTAGDDRAETVVLDGAYLYVAGTQESPPLGPPTERSWRIEKRLVSTGDLVLGFGTSGAIVSANFGNGAGCAILSDATSLYVTGIVENPLGSGILDSRLEKRSLSDGSLVTTFGTGGVVTGGGGISIATDGASLYCGGVQDFATDAKLRIEKRSMTDGSLVSGFGSGGILTINANPTAGAVEVCTALAVDGAYLYAFENVETGSGTGIYPWRIEKRDLATGTTTVVTVAGAGIAHLGPGGGFLLAGGGSLYVAGRDSASATDGQWRFEKRKTSDLTLDTTFNTTGIVTFNPTVSADEEFTEGLFLTGGVLFAVGTDNGVARRWRIEARYR